MTLNFTQVYFEDSQRDKIYPFAKAFKNEYLDDYFENRIIAGLVPNMDEDFLSVCSWRLHEKRQSRLRLLDKSLTEEKILAADFDVAILTPYSDTHRPLDMGAKWHGRPFIEGIEELRKFYPFRGDDVKHAIYENHFIARREIYHDYVKSCLIPVMAFMVGNSVFTQDGGYSKRKKPEEVAAVVAKLGHAWTIAPFILERLFSIWIDRKNFKVINL